MEGPSVRAIAEKLSGFTDGEILSASGNSKIEKGRAQGRKVQAIFSRGKNLLITLPDVSIRIHFLMFGSYRMNEEREGMRPRLALLFDNGSLNFYNCSVKFIENEEIDLLYPEQLDITSPEWNLDQVMDLVSKRKEQSICDILLDQEIFLGVGNIIKNEALFLSRTHPLSMRGRMSDAQAQRVAAAAREFSMEFYEVKRKEDLLNKHLQIYRKRKCPACKGKVTAKKTGERQRRSFFCATCQVLYA